MSTAHFPAKRGDLLFFPASPNLVTRLIQFGERLEDGNHRIVPYHVAIAVSPFEQIAASTHGVAQSEIDYDQVLITRPPYDVDMLTDAIAWLTRQKGRLYGWIGVVDQGLRDATHDVIHLPDALVRWSDRRWPFCSSLAAEFMRRAGYEHVRRWPPPDPETLWLETRDYMVPHWRYRQM